MVQKPPSLGGASETNNMAFGLGWGSTGQFPLNGAKIAPSERWHLRQLRIDS